MSWKTSTQYIGRKRVKQARIDPKSKDWLRCHLSLFSETPFLIQIDDRCEPTYFHTLYAFIADRCLKEVGNWPPDLDFSLLRRLVQHSGTATVVVDVENMHRRMPRPRSMGHASSSDWVKNQVKEAVRAIICCNNSMRDALLVCDELYEPEAWTIGGGHLVTRQWAYIVHEYWLEAMTEMQERRATWYRDYQPDFLGYLDKMRKVYKTTSDRIRRDTMKR